MIATLISALNRIGLQPTEDEIADALWLAIHVGSLSQLTEPESKTQWEKLPSVDEHPLPSDEDESSNHSSENGGADSVVATYDMDFPRSQSSSNVQTKGGVLFRTPAASALPGTLELSRAFRPLMRRVPSRTEFVFDEKATARQIAEEHIWIPVLLPASTRWFDVALIVDEGISMDIWQPAVGELQLLLERLGAFRDVRRWGLVTDERNGQREVLLYPRTSLTANKNRAHNPKELLDPLRRRLILVVTDCVSNAWRDNAIVPLLSAWGRINPVAIVQVLPQRLWFQSALRMAQEIRISTPLPGVPNTQLKSQVVNKWISRQPVFSIPIPIITLEPLPISLWAQHVTGSGNNWIPGFTWPVDMINHQGSSLLDVSITAEQRVQQFRAVSSSTAFDLAGLLAAAPLRLPIMRLVQQAMLPQSRQIHLAEVFLSGLLKRVLVPATNSTNDPDSNQYDFVDDVRDVLLDSINVPDAVQVLKVVSQAISGKIGQTFDFLSILVDPTTASSIEIDEQSKPFALLAANILRRLGGHYAKIADQIELSNTTEPLAESNDIITSKSPSLLAEKKNHSIVTTSPDPLLNNPYYNTSALRNSNMLFGRTLLLRRIYSALVNRQCVSLVGIRQMGKSSLLHCLRQPELLQQFEYDFSHYIFVLIDLREYRHKNNEDFFAAVSRQIILQSRGRLENLSLDHGTEHIFSFLLDQISEQNFHTVLLMDAFDNVTHNSNFDLSFFSYLRSLATLGKVSYVTATIAPLNKVSHSSIEESPFFNIFSKYTLPPLASDDAYALATQPAMQAGLPFTEQEVTCALDLAGRHPFFIQRVCHILFEEKERLYGDEVDRDHFAALAHAELEPYFESLWNRLEHEQQERLKNQVLFENSSNNEIPELSESSLFRRFTSEKFALQRYTPTLEVVEKALEMLQNLSALGETDLQYLRIVSLRTRRAALTSAEKGIAIREVLAEAFEHLRGTGYRNDSEPAWQAYNILYYRYFKQQLKIGMIAARLGISSRQYFRARKNAIKALLGILIEMDNKSTEKNKK